MGDGAGVDVPVGTTRNADAALSEARRAASEPHSSDGTPGAGDNAGHPTARVVHRWRDLDRRDRRWALAFAAALVLAPVAALAVHLPDWSPQADPALMALRSLDTGTVRTPLLGQPSQSSAYVESVAPVHHPGPLHLYLMALPIRLLGGTLGMLTTSVLVTATCLVTAAWAVFRQLGRTAGVVAALALGAVAFTTGASSLVNPVSSSIAGYPLLLSAVLLWCVATGDVHLMPAAAAATSFTAQQHLSVVPSIAVLTAGAVALLAAAWWRAGHWHRPAGRRTLARWCGWSAVVGLVLWSPVLVQQVFGTNGNLGRMLWFARQGDSPSLGYTSGLWQVVHALGLPPLLGRTEVTGYWLISRPSAAAWASAAAVAALVAGLSARWRRLHPQRARLGAMVGVTAVAGLVNGSSVPVGIEQGRLSFYHWAFVLAFFVALVVGLGAVELVRRVLDRDRTIAPGRLGRGALVGVALAAVAAPSLVNPALDRPTNHPAAANAYIDPSALEVLADAAAARADDIGEHPVLLARDVPPFQMYADSLAFALVERGVDVRFPLGARHFVHHDRLVEHELLDGGLVLVVDDEMPGDDPGGDLVAAVDLPTDLDLDAYRALVAAVGATDEVVLGTEVEAALDADERTMAETVLVAALDDPEAALLRADIVGFLAAHPDLEQPALDPRVVARHRTSLGDLDDDWRRGTTTRLRLYLLDRGELLRTASPGEVGTPPR